MLGRPLNNPSCATQAAGLAAVHSVAEALKDEHSGFAWLLRREALLRFGYGPDGAFYEAIDKYDFRKQGGKKITESTY